MSKRVKVYFDGEGLGDTIGWMGQVERYQKITGNEVYVFCKFNDIFAPDNIKVSPKNSPLVEKTYDESFVIGYCGWQRPSNLRNEVKDIKASGLMQMASEILGLEDFKEVKPVLNIKPKDIKLKRRTVSIASLTTMQQKFWNYKGGWNAVISHLKKKGIDTISIDGDSQFGAGYPLGDIPAFNPIPSASKDKTGLSLQKAANYIQKSVFFMGLASGLSWLAWALDKPVVMILGSVAADYHFSNPYVVQNKNVCHDCWRNHDMIGDEWYWCPEDKNFECSRQITPEMVIEKINTLL